MASTVKAFESRLDKFWKNQPVLFNYKEELSLSFNDLGTEDHILCPDNYDDDDDDDDAAVFDVSA